MFAIIGNQCQSISYCCRRYQQINVINWLSAFPGFRINLSRNVGDALRKWVNDVLRGKFKKRR